MRYLLKFWDKKEMVVSQEDGERVMLAKEQKIDCVRIHGGIYEAKAIAYVEPVVERLEISESGWTPPATVNPVRKETIERLKKELAEKFKWK